MLRDKLFDSSVLKSDVPFMPAKLGSFFMRLFSEKPRARDPIVTGAGRESSCSRLFVQILVATAYRRAPLAVQRPAAGDGRE